MAGNALPKWQRIRGLDHMVGVQEEICTVFTSNGVVEDADEPRLKFSGELRQDAAANPTSESFCCWNVAKFWKFCRLNIFCTVFFGMKIRAEHNSHNISVDGTIWMVGKMCICFERYMYSLVPLICATAADDNFACASCISGDKLWSLEAAAAAAANAKAFWLFNRFVTS